MDMLLFGTHRDIGPIVGWCFEPSQPLGIISGLRETLIAVGYCEGERHLHLFLFSFMCTYQSLWFCCCGGGADQTARGREEGQGVSQEGRWGLGSGADKLVFGSARSVVPYMQAVTASYTQYIV